MKKFLIIFLSIFLLINSCFWSILLTTVQDRENYEAYQKWYNLYEKWKYLLASEILEPTLSSCNNTDLCKVIVELLESCYINQWIVYYHDKEYKNSIFQYQNALNINPNNYTTLVNLWLVYISVWKRDKSIEYYEKALQYTNNQQNIKNINNNIEYAKQQKQVESYIWNVKYKAYTNDLYNKYQYYLEQLNIYDAWRKIPDETNTVTVAIIDDWVNIKHDDLHNTLWHNSWEIQWNWIDDDKNWYIDDYYWRNFDQNNNKIAPIDSHGTTIAWIIWAETNNNAWIAWISKNVKIIPLAVFNKSWYALDYNIIKAIEYAIDKWANIINLSIWSDVSTNYSYNKAYDDVLKKAHENGIVIVAAAWNGEINQYWEKIWINTSIKKLSPVCNDINNNKKTILWVWALNTKSWISEWTNYWDCVDFYAPGEKIVSIWMEKNSYQIVDWTSFSAPIIVWIIALGYNKYWKINPDDVYDLLNQSKNWNTINAVKYIENLDNYFDNLWWEELEQAITWMYNNWLTIYQTPSAFMYNKWLRRDEATKFFVKYAKNIIWIAPDYNRECSFYDLDEARPDLKDLIVESCQLWLFQWYNWNFMPSQYLTNAQALTVFMRILKWWEDELWNHFADNYQIKAKQLWIIDWLPFNDRNQFDQNTTRWNVARLIFRWFNL